MKYSVAIGKIAVPIKVTNECARFTLVSDNDHYMVEAGPELLQIVQSAGATGKPVLVAGEDFTYFWRSCHGHHSGLRASAILPMTDIDSMYAQLVKLLPDRF